MTTTEAILICLAVYAALFVPLYLFIRGASRCVYVSSEEWQMYFDEMERSANNVLQEDKC